MKYKPFNLKHALIIIASAVLFALAWGFLIGGDTVNYMCFGSFCLVAAVTSVLRKKEGHWGWSSVLVTVIIAFVTTMFSVGVYGTVNEMHGEKTDAYDAPVVEVYYYKGTYIAFEDRDGNRREVDVYPWQENDALYDLETIHIEEYEGLFQITFYKWSIE